ncbi:MAG: putative F420-0 ABC transporter substrate-binding protein [Actinomycetales bacterium]|nr:putative F420-0 ABC transporter substrate-binding protein [Actinomycetales bacterium]
MRHRAARPVAIARTVAASAVVVVSLAACAASPGAASGPTTALPADSASPATESPATENAYPLTVTNCGIEVTVLAAPERIVTIKSSTTELALALGLADRMVGAAFLDGPLADEVAAAGADVPVISDALPNAEAVLELAPDLVFAGWESNLTAEGAGERDVLAGLDIASYVPPAACRESGPPPVMSFDVLFEQIAETGDVLGAPEAAAELVAKQRTRLEAVVPDTRELDALWYSSGSQTPYVGAGTGVPQMILEAAGLSNIAADVADSWTSISWEEVVARDPDVIVLVDSAWNTAENKKQVLAENPATSALDAVREGRYLVVPFPATEAGVRNVAAVESLVAQLTELALD